VTFDLQPILIGESLMLRPLRRDDFAALFAVASDPLIWAQHPVRDRYTEPVFTSFFGEAIASGGALVAIDRVDDRVIGTSRFNTFDPVRSEVEIGWTFLARSHWGGVHNGEMKALMITHAFRFVASVLFVVGPDNLRSQRAVEKIGGVRDGRRRDDTGLDSLVFRIRASDWLRRNADQVDAEAEPGSPG